MGCDGTRSRRSSRPCDFNPRTPVGCDLKTRNWTKKPTAFQSTHPSGVRRPWYAIAGVIVAFQSTHPSGVRHQNGTHIQRTNHFNPRTPVGCDRPKTPSKIRQNISIHAPQWGATRALRRYRWHDIDFNPRTPVGCDSMARRASSEAVYFNPRTPVGCDDPP